MYVKKLERLTWENAGISYQNNLPIGCTSWNPFKQWLCVSWNQAKTSRGSQTHISGQCRSLSQRSCRLSLVAHTCWDPFCATQCRAHSVAATSRNFRDVEGVSRYFPHTLPKKDPVAPILPPPCHTSLSLWRGEISLQKRIALHGV